MWLLLLGRSVCYHMECIARFKRTHRICRLDFNKRSLLLLLLLQCVQSVMNVLMRHRLEHVAHALIIKIEKPVHSLASHNLDGRA